MARRSSPADQQSEKGRFQRIASPPPPAAHGAVRRADLIAAVEKAGYGVIDTSGVADMDDAERQAREAEIRRQRNLVISVRFSPSPSLF